MEVELLFDVPPEKFLPSPKVDLLRYPLCPAERPAVEVEDEAFFFKVLRGGFLLRRKTLANSLSAALPGLPKEAVQRAIAQAGLPADIRGERLRLEEFAALAAALRRDGEGDDFASRTVYDIDTKMPPPRRLRLPSRRSFRKEVIEIMTTIDLRKYGITGTPEIVYNPSFEQLFQEETRPGLTGFDKGQVSELGAVNVMTGRLYRPLPQRQVHRHGRHLRDTGWWTSPEFKNDNHPASIETWNAVKKLAQEELSNKRLFVVDGFCGATTTPAWPSASSWRWPGRPTS